MKINRGRFFHSTRYISIPESSNETQVVPIIEAVNPPTPPIVYQLSDFGENAINNHAAVDAWHSTKNQIIFNYITRDYRDRCTSYESYNTPALGNNLVSDELKACKAVKADIVYTPYVNAASWTNTDNDNLIITVGAHYDNDGQYDIASASDNNRHDITPNANTFLSDSIAVSARRDTPELFKNSTSEGFGMEFFEDCSPDALDVDYPDADIPIAFAELLTEDGTNLTSNVHPTFSQYLSVGDEITIRHTSNPATWETATVSEIVSGSHIRVSSPITVISGAGVYGWHNVTLGTFIGAQQQSWAVPVVAGKLKVIKMETNSDWDTVRAAARATAKRNPTGITEIDNAKWDIYRGFGVIDANGAIEYINNM